MSVRLATALLAFARDCQEEPTSRAQFLDRVRIAANAEWDNAEEKAHAEGRYLRTPEGTINNCSLAAGEASTGCQICAGSCPDRTRFEGGAR